MPGYRPMKIIGAPQGRDKSSSRRRRLGDVDGRSLARTPETSRGRQGRGRREAAKRPEEWKSLPVIYIGPRSSGKQAVSEGGIRARDYKVTDEGTDGRRDRDAAGRYANATSAMAL